MEFEFIWLEWKDNFACLAWEHTSQEWLNVVREGKWKFDRFCMLDMGMCPNLLFHRLTLELILAEQETEWDTMWFLKLLQEKKDWKNDWFPWTSPELRETGLSRYRPSFTSPTTSARMYEKMRKSRYTWVV